MGEIMEKDMRKSPNLAGTWVLLGDGAKWCVPALPLGKDCEPVLASMEKLFEAQDKHKKNAATDTAGIVAATRELMAIAADFAFALLKVNYPRLEREYFDSNNLVTLQHSNIFQEIVQGTTALGETIGEKNPGEAKLAAI